MSETEKLYNHLQTVHDVQPDSQVVGIIGPGQAHKIDHAAGEWDHDVRDIFTREEQTA